MKIVISGYGKMGRMVEKILAEKGIECAAVSESIADTDPGVASGSVCIDFTVPEAFLANYKFIAEHFKAVVVGTTGWYDRKEEVIGYFERCSTPMIYASNFSIGVNVFFRIAGMLSGLLKKSGEYEPYILEMHHRHKLDAPSGTAKTLSAIVEENTEKPVDIQSVRCGEIPGIHRLGFESSADRITISHEAFSREGFARGAVEAALMTEVFPGVHEFKDLIVI